VDPSRRELLVARISSGTTRVRVGGRTYLVRRPDRAAVYSACEVYDEALRDGHLEGLFTEPELTAWMLRQGLWDEDRQKALELLPKQMDDQKVAMYQAVFRSKERAVIRKALGLARTELARLTEEHGAFAHMTCTGAAGLAKARYLTAAGLCTESGAPVFAGSDYWDDRSDLVDGVMAALAAARPDEAAYRELARTEPWRTLWNGHRVERQLFGAAPPDWTEEQRVLVNWSLLYDNVYQSPECPSDEAVADDDLLDGWLLLQRRERERRNGSADAVVANEKVRGSQEVFIVAETDADASKVMGLNDDHARALSRSRFSHLARKGQVNELDMPDTAQRLRTEITQKLLAATGPGGG
jgi:hypothetical protein